MPASSDDRRPLVLDDLTPEQQAQVRLRSEHLLEAVQPPVRTALTTARTVGFR